MRNLMTAALVVLIVPTFLLSCEHMGQRESEIIHVGDSVAVILTRMGRPIREAHYNQSVEASRFTPEATFTGVAYWPATSIRVQRVEFKDGLAVSVRNVPNR